MCRPCPESEFAQREAPARPGEFRAFVLGRAPLWPPVILAPMAGVTNLPYRRLCRELGAPLCINEMVSARPLAENQPKTWQMVGFAADEYPRSQQLYGTSPEWIERAVRRLVDDQLIDHLDLNFGCPVRKVTRQGGGAALPHRPQLLGRIVAAAVRAAGSIPVTIKFRLGLDEEHLNYLETGHIAEASGCQAVTLHARTAEQFYDGAARWDAIAELKTHLSIPVLGNGDVWEAADALRMLRTTGCDAVVIGRGCLGRPWLFAELRGLFDGQRPSTVMTLGSAFDLMLRHARGLCDWMGEPAAMRAFRRHATWYTKGFRGSARLRCSLSGVESLGELEAIRQSIDPTLPLPASALRLPRGKSGGQQRVVLPDGYMEPEESSLEHGVAPGAR